MVLDTTLSQRDRLLFVLLFLLEVSIVAILKILHMKGEMAIGIFALSIPGFVFLAASLVVLVTGAVLIHLYRAHRRSPSRYFRLIVAMNLITVFLMMVAGEILVRAASRPYLNGEAIGTVLLKPKNWDMTREHYRELIGKASGDLSYLVYDDQVGWSVGSNRRSANGLYRSSPKGVRGPHEGVVFPVNEGRSTVVLIGDSYTFGEEVTYEESWGYQLSRLLSEEAQVVNLGVPGYGVDQAYLRYKKDAGRWKPKVTIFGLFAHDLSRTLTVYTFLAHPHWGLPFSKPRFILSNGRLQRLNEPTLRPEAIFSHPSISELQFLELDRGYEESTWQQSFYHASYLFRLFVSWYPSWSASIPAFLDEELVSINSSILKAFVRDTEREGTIPVVVFFPGRGELEKMSSNAEMVLYDAGIEYVDTTPCLQEVDPDDRFMPGGHYSPAGNAAVAKCLLPVVQEKLRKATVS